MRNVLCLCVILVALTLASSTHGQSLGDNLHGEWVADRSATKQFHETSKTQGFDIDEFPGLTMHFTEDGKFTFVTGEDKFRGTFKSNVSDSDDNTLDVLLQREGGSNQLKGKVVFLDDSKIRVEPENEFAILFVRRGKKALGKTTEDPWCVYPAGNGPGEGKQIVLLSGDEEYRSEEALPMLGKILAQRYGFKCTVLFAIDEATGQIDPNNQNNIPGMDQLESADLVIMSLRFRNLPDEQMKYFDAYVKSGKPIIGLRTSTHAFNYPRESTSDFKHYSYNSPDWKQGFGKQVLGETWVSHHGDHKKQSCRGVVNAEQSGHAVLEGVKDVWGPTDVYGIRELPKDAQVLLWGQVLTGMSADDPPVDGKQNDPMMPLAWVRDYEPDSGNRSKIFCTTMGSSTDFESEGLRRLIINASFWCLEMESAIPDLADVRYIDSYEPTDYGFNGFRKGLSPRDFDLKSK